jgi:mRNA interferase RelE/StbE
MDILYTSKAASQLGALSTEYKARIANKMRFYAQQRDIMKFAKYIAWRGDYRFRVGDYRIFFEVRNNILIIRTILRRDSAYE